MNKLVVSNINKSYDKKNLVLKDVSFSIQEGTFVVIVGPSGCGKSTLLRFIENIFYGISKNKNGKPYSNFEKYKPWEGEEFSGKIEYALDNNENFEVFRDFKKKNPKIFNENKEDIKKLAKKMEGHYQKAGIVKYDAFHEMGGNLSFALAMLDANDNGWIFNAMHSREGCYTYIKEIVKGESYIELSEEEQQCLEKTIYQEEYDIKTISE